MSVTYKDYYRILGLERDADERAVKAAFRRQARRYHPDVNAGDTQAGQLFKEVHEAYQILSDPARRRRYDAAYGITAARVAPTVDRGAPTSAYSAAAPPRPTAWSRALRRFWQEERAALAYTTRRVRLSRVRLGYGVAAAVVGALLLCVLTQQQLNPSRPWLTNVSRIPASSGAPRPRHDAPRHAQTPARPAPVYLLGGCLRDCPSTTPGQIGRVPASTSRVHPPATPRPLYLYGGCIRHCPPTRRPTSNGVQ